MEEEKPKVSWIDAMVEREALPAELREGTGDDFCEKYKVPKSTYYYHLSKPEIKQRIIEISLNNAKRFVPEVLENLAKRAQENTRDTELYLKFVLALREKTDMTSGGDKINFTILHTIGDKYDTTKSLAGGSSKE